MSDGSDPLGEIDKHLAEAMSLLDIGLEAEAFASKAMLLSRIAHASAEIEDALFIIHEMKNRPEPS